MRRRAPQYAPAADSLFYWFDGADRSTFTDNANAPIAGDGSAWLRWHNKGSHGSYMQAEVAPTWKAGAGAVLTNVGHRLQIADKGGLRSLSGLTLCAVVKPSVVNADHHIFSIYGSVYRALIQIFGGRARVTGTRINSDSYQPLDGGLVVPGQRMIITAAYSYSQALLDLHVNGVFVARRAFQTPGLSPATDPVGVFMGRTQADDPAIRLVGDYSELRGALEYRSPDALVPMHHEIRTKWEQL